MTLTRPVSATRAPPRAPWWVAPLRLLGWACIAAGVVVALYLVYSLFFTNLETSRAQDELLGEWELAVGSVGTGGAQQRGEGDAPAHPGAADGSDVQAGAARGAGGETPDEPQAPVGDGGGRSQAGEGVRSATTAGAAGSAVAVLEFHRPADGTRPVQDRPLLVVSGVRLSDLTRGPGHYPGSALPDQPGNFAVAGHRTTYGAPFFHLDQLQAGDQVHVTDRQGVRHVYEVRELRVVLPTDVWVLDADPLGTGAPTLTLTTCHPRFSNAQRMIVFAELIG